MRKCATYTMNPSQRQYCREFFFSPIKVGHSDSFIKQAARSGSLDAGVDIVTIVEILGNTVNQCLNGYLHVSTR